MTTLSGVDILPGFCMQKTLKIKDLKAHKCFSDRCGGASAAAFFVSGENYRTANMAGFTLRGIGLLCTNKVNLWVHHENAKYNGYEQRYEAVKKVEMLQTQKEERQTQADSISAFMFELHELDEPITTFDDKLWLSVIDIVVVRHDGTLVFKFRNGMEVEA